MSYSVKVVGWRGAVPMIDACVADFPKLSDTPWPPDLKWIWRAVDEDGEAAYFEDKPTLGLWQWDKDDPGEYIWESPTDASAEFCVMDAAFDAQGRWNNDDYKNSLESRPQPTDSDKDT